MPAPSFDMQHARNLIQHQQWERGAQACEAIIRDQPANIDAAYLLSIAYLNLGKVQPAVAMLEKITEVQPSNTAAKNMLAIAYAQNSDFGRAASIGQQLLKQQPNNRTLKQQLAYFLFQAGKYTKSIQLNKELLTAEPENAALLGNISAALIRTGQFDAAEPYAKRAAKAAPSANSYDVQIGLIKLAQKAHAQAEAAFRRALAKAPSAEALNGLATALALQGHRLEARDYYASLFEQFPQFTEALAPYGQLLYELGDFDRASQILPLAVNAQPDNIQLRADLARILLDRSRYTEARQLLQDADRDNPAPDLLSLIGAIELALNHYPEAIHYFERVLAKNPNHIEARLGYLSATRHICDFAAFDREVSRFLPDFRANPDIPVAPFLFISFPGATAKDHLEAANRQAATLHRALAAQKPLKEPEHHSDHILGQNVDQHAEENKSHDKSKAEKVRAEKIKAGKIRIGFLTNDFRQHATSHLMIEFLEQLDHAAFEWHAFSWGQSKEEDTLRPRVEAALDQWHDISHLSDHDAAQLIKNQAIDVLIDLKGYTQGCRPLITARQPAKTQINWLGFPGSMGQKMAQYIITDPVICPEGSEDQFAEKVLRMPHWYMPTPQKTKVPRRKARTSYGLPKQGIVYGDFNQSYKITSDAFKLWCQILKAVPDSVLWLLEHTPHTTANLKKTAEAHGIDSSRLIFAERLPHAENLARLSHMDIMLDTFYYNGHTTTSDALSQGVPVITKMGKTFPSRVAASLLNASGLSELVCSSNKDYLKKAIELGQNPDQLAALRANIKKNHPKLATLNNKQFARDFEALIKQVIAN